MQESNDTEHYTLGDENKRGTRTFSKRPIELSRKRRCCVSEEFPQLRHTGLKESTRHRMRSFERSVYVRYTSYAKEIRVCIGSLAVQSSGEK